MNFSKLLNKKVNNLLKLISKFSLIFLKNQKNWKFFKSLMKYQDPNQRLFLITKILFDSRILSINSGLSSLFIKLLKISGNKPNYIFFQIFFSNFPDLFFKKEHLHTLTFFFQISIPKNCLKLKYFLGFLLPKFILPKKKKFQKKNFVFFFSPKIFSRSIYLKFFCLENFISIFFCKISYIFCSILIQALIFFFLKFRKCSVNCSIKEDILRNLNFIIKEKTWLEIFIRIFKKQDISLLTKIKIKIIDCKHLFEKESILVFFYFKLFTSFYSRKRYRNLNDQISKFLKKNWASKSEYSKSIIIFLKNFFSILSKNKQQGLVKKKEIFCPNFKNFFSKNCFKDLYTNIVILSKKIQIQKFLSGIFLNLEINSNFKKKIIKKKIKYQRKNLNSARNHLSRKFYNFFLFFPNHKRKNSFSKYIFIQLVLEFMKNLKSKISCFAYFFLRRYTNTNKQLEFLLAIEKLNGDICFPIKILLNNFLYKCWDYQLFEE